jgi:hypothetical protein
MDYSPFANYHNIWKTSADFAEPLVVSDEFAHRRETAFTVIMSQATEGFFFGRVCAKDYFVNNAYVGKSGHKVWGTGIILEIHD